MWIMVRDYTHIGSDLCVLYCITYVRAGIITCTDPLLHPVVDIDIPRTLMIYSIFRIRIHQAYGTPT